MNATQREQLPLFLKAMPVPLKETLVTSLVGKGVTIVSDTQGMVMMSVLDCFDAPFHLGEVLARQVKVSFQSHIAAAIVVSDSFDDAFITATMHLAYGIDHHEFLTMISEFLTENAHYRIEAEAIDRGIAATTKVNFGLMVEG